MGAVLVFLDEDGAIGESQWEKIESICGGGSQVLLVGGGDEIERKCPTPAVEMSPAELREIIEAWPIYPDKKSPLDDPFELMKAIDRRRHGKIQEQCRQLHFQEPKTLKPSTRLKPPLFSRRMEGGRAQRHRQKWKMRRQKEGIE